VRNRDLNKVLPEATGGSSESGYHSARSVEELTQRNIRTVAALEDSTRAERSTADCVADAIAGFCGSMAFVYVHLIWFGCWIGVNLPFMPKAVRFDPFPFQFLTLIVSLEAIFLSTFLLISQNRQGRLSDRRNHLDLQINLLSEQENSKMMTMLESIQKKLGIDDSDPEIHVLEEATEPNRLAAQINEIIENRERAAAK